MSKSRNDYHRNRFRDYDDEMDYRESSVANPSHRKNKRIKNALRSKNISELYDFDDE